MRDTDISSPLMISAATLMLDSESQKMKLSIYLNCGGLTLKKKLANTSTAFSNYLAKNGIKHELTNPYTLQENGVSKCANWTLNNLAHSMIADAQEVLQAKSLPTALWS